MSKRKKVIIVDTPEEEIEEIEELESEKDVFEELEGVGIDAAMYTFFRKAENGSLKYIYKSVGPCSIHEIAMRFGGGEYRVFAKDAKGKNLKQKDFEIDHAFDQYLNNNKKEESTKTKILEEMKLYKELFTNNNDQFMEHAAKSMGIVSEMSNKMMHQHIDLMDKLNQVPESNNEMMEMITGLVKGFASGKVLQMPGAKGPIKTPAAGSGNKIKKGEEQ